MTRLATLLFLVAVAAATAQGPRAPAPAAPERLEDLLRELEHLVRFDLRDAIATAERAVELAEANDDPAAAAIARGVQARAAVRLLGPAEGRAKLEAARALVAELPDDEAQAARAWVALAGANVHWTLDEPTECLVELRRALDLAEASDAPRAQVRAHLLALSVVGFPEDPLAEVARIEAIASRADDPGFALEVELLYLLVRRASGELADTRPQLEQVLARARLVGDRAVEGYVGHRLAEHFANDDLERARAFATGSLEAVERLGDREDIALAHELLARLSVKAGDVDAAEQSCQRALAALDGMGMVDRSMLVLATAASIASLAGDAATAQERSQQHAALRQQMDARATANQRAELWRETRDLRDDLRAMRAEHATELAEVQGHMRTVIVTGGAAIVALLAISTLLLLRNQRRLRGANAQLEQTLTASEELRAEREALAQNLQQLERLDSIGLLAGGFAHDFNNILVAVRGNAQLLLTEDGFDGDQREMLDQIVEASTRAAGLCKDILSYANATPTPTSTYDVREILEAMAPLARAGFGASVELTLALGGRSRLVEGDRAQLEQVFLNLLVNAGEAIEDHGRVLVAVDEVELPVGKPDRPGQWFGELPTEAGTYVAISVMDEGAGMSADTVRRIFDPFFSTRFAGRGLGLAAVFGILRRHRGLVQVQSAPGEGTEFTIYLPRRSDTATLDANGGYVLPRPTSDLPITTVATPTTVLVVDDEPIVREVARGVLEADGHDVVTADGGKDALEQMRAHGHSVELALLDVTMPEMDGPALADLLQRDFPRLRVVLMTGHAESAIRGGTADRPLLLKPFDLRELRDTVRRTLATARTEQGQSAR